MNTLALLQKTIDLLPEGGIRKEIISYRDDIVGTIESGSTYFDDKELLFDEVIESIAEFVYRFGYKQPWSESVKDLWIRAKEQNGQ